MTARLLDCPAGVGSPEWHAARGRGIGGSEVAAIVGLSPWESPYSLWQRKAGRIPPQWESPSMNWGKRLEPPIADAFGEGHPEFLQLAAGLYGKGFQIASPDQLLADVTGEPVAVLEVKTADSFDRDSWGPSGSDEIPPYYRCQVLWYLDVLDLPVAHIAVLIGGNDYREYTIEASAREQAWLRWRGRKFWRSLLDGTPPDLDDSVHTYEAVRQLHGDIEASVEVEIDEDAYTTWRDGAIEIKRTSARVTHAKSTIADAMGSARYGLHFGSRVVIRQSTRGGTPYPKLVPERKGGAI